MDPDTSFSPGSEEFITRKLPSMLVDSMLLDHDFNVVAVSQNILDLLEFSLEEVQRKNLSYLSTSTDLVSLLKAEQSRGYFDERPVTFLSKSNKRHRLCLSGFCLGSVSKCEGYVVLKIDRSDKARTDEPCRKTAELDRFIYRTAHDLRGPLATIKGLINLIKIRKNNEELDRFVMLLESHANKLDERLFQLVYVAQSDHAPGSSNLSVNFDCIETSLRKIIEKNAFVDFLEFNYSAPARETLPIEEALLTGLLSNILLYILSLPMSSVQVQVFFKLQLEDGSLNVTITTQGFETNSPFQAAIQESESLYFDMIEYPQLMNFYAARKIALQLNATVKVQFAGENQQQINIRVPFSTSALSTYSK